ncbi:MAG: P1 family peptidase [Pseudomonadota bacterium]
MPPQWSPEGSPTSVPGFQVGHAQCPAGRSGASVVLCPPATVGGVAVRGSAAGSRQMDGLNPEHMVNEVHALVFTGGSSFGLDAGGGVQAYLAERGVGFKAGPYTVPVAPTAVIFDLPLNPEGQRPDAAVGRAACVAAGGGVMARGNVGAGAGATVGKLFGPAQAMKGGLGGASLSLGGLHLGAMAVVNAFGDVMAGDGRLVAGARREAQGLELIDTAAWFLEGHRRQAFLPPSNTTLGVVVTNARLDKLTACKLAGLAHHGLVQSVRPVHTIFDGDLVVVLASGEVEADLTGLGLMAAECLRRAVLDAVWSAEGLPGLPCARQLPGARDPRPDPASPGPGGTPCP